MELCINAYCTILVLRGFSLPSSAVSMRGMPVCSSCSRKQGNTDMILDRTGERFFHIAGWWWAVILGYIIGLTTMSIGGRYVAMFLMAAGYTGAICF